MILAGANYESIPFFCLFLIDTRSVWGTTFTQSERLRICCYSHLSAKSLGPKHKILGAGASAKTWARFRDVQILNGQSDIPIQTFASHTLNHIVHKEGCCFRPSLANCLFMPGKALDSSVFSIIIQVLSTVCLFFLNNPQLVSKMWFVGLRSFFKCIIPAVGKVRRDDSAFFWRKICSSTLQAFTDQVTMLPLRVFFGVALALDTPDCEVGFGYERRGKPSSPHLSHVLRVSQRSPKS